MKDINTAGSAASSSPREIVQVGTFLYFAADGGTGQSQLWRTDGTGAGTRSVKLFDSFCGPFDSYFKGPMKLTNLNGMLLFFVDDGVSGFELWRSHGTETGTVLVTEGTKRPS